MSEDTPDLDFCAKSPRTSARTGSRRQSARATLSEGQPGTGRHHGTPVYHTTCTLLGDLENGCPLTPIPPLFPLFLCPLPRVAPPVEDLDRWYTRTIQDRLGWTLRGPAHGKAAAKLDRVGLDERWHLRQGAPCWLRAPVLDVVVRTRAVNQMTSSKDSVQLARDM